MKKNFITGLVLLVPTALTFIIISFLVNILTAPFLGVVSSLVSYLLPDHVESLFESYDLTIITKLFILVLLLAGIVLTGFLTRMVLFNTFINIVDSIAHAIPGFRHIYKSIRETVHTLVGSQKSPFSSVVLVPFAKGYSLGLISSEKQEEYTTVYVPLAMNLTYGLLIKYKSHQLIPIDMPFESALKTVISCGAVFPEFKILPKTPQALQEDLLHEE
jgi:uncharacterized membrane protein